MSKLALIEEDFSKDFEHLFGGARATQNQNEALVRVPQSRSKRVSAPKRNKPAIIESMSVQAIVMVLMGRVGKWVVKHKVDIQACGFWLLLVILIWVQ